MKAKCILWLLTGLVLIFGCTKPAAEPKTETVAEVSDFEESEIYFYDPGVPQGVFVIDGALHERRSDGRMYWKANINAGDTVEWAGEIQEAVRSDGEKRNFCRVIAEVTKDKKEEFWVQHYYIYGPAVPAIIVNTDAVLYNRPDPGAVARSGTVTLSKYTFVAMIQDDDLTDEFIPIAAQLGGSSPAERWVKVQDLSWDVSVVAGVKLARSAAAQPNVAARKRILDDAMKTLSGSNLRIPDMVRNDPALFELELSDNLDLLSERRDYRVNTDLVNVRDFPSTNSNVVDQLNSGKVVTITARSKKKVTIKATEEGEEDMTGQWFRTENGSWIFSYFLDSYDRDW